MKDENSISVRVYFGHIFDLCVGLGELYIYSGGCHMFRNKIINAMHARIRSKTTSIVITILLFNLGTSERELVSMLSQNKAFTSSIVLSGWLST